MGRRSGGCWPRPRCWPRLRCLRTAVPALRLGMQGAQRSLDHACRRGGRRGSDQGGDRTGAQFFCSLLGSLSPLAPCRRSRVPPSTSAARSAEPDASSHGGARWRGHLRGLNADVSFGQSGCRVVRRLRSPPARNDVVMHLPIAVLSDHGKSLGGASRSVGFWILPIRPILYTRAGNGVTLLAVQRLDGAGAGIFSGPTSRVVADLRRGPGRYNLARAASRRPKKPGASLLGFGEYAQQEAVHRLDRNRLGEPPSAKRLPLAMVFQPRPSGTARHGPSERREQGEWKCRLITV